MRALVDRGRRGSAVRGACARFQLSHQRARLVARVELAKRRDIRLGRRERLKRLWQLTNPMRMVASLRDSSSVTSPARRFSPTLPDDLVHVLDQPVERAVLVQELRRGLRPHLLDAGDVVRASRPTSAR